MTATQLLSRPAIVRRRIAVRGIVQGVGFRPFVWRLASELGLDGWVRNDAAGVTIEVQGEHEHVLQLARRVRDEAPTLARVDTVAVDECPLVEGGNGFAIQESGGGLAGTAIGPDSAICADCLAELFDPADRRYRHAFINCTNCGPRYTITRSLPYDRAMTSMAAFVQCAQCGAEYGSPRDRRFHAEPNGCADCGPRLAFLDAAGAPIAGVDPVAATLAALARGAVVAIKGLGGFHLACDARNAAAVAALRARKSREEKPFAVMAANVSSLLPWAAVAPAERSLLESAERPIVLLRRRDGVDDALPGVAPALAWLGAMLPYTPLQYLLFHEAAGRPAGTAWLADAQDLVLVMTSANPGGEPLVIANDEALARLAGIADRYLLHDRDIVIRCDDSVVRALSAAGPSQGAKCAPSGGSAAAELANEAASVGAVPSAAGPSQVAKCAPSGGSAAAELAHEAASVGARSAAAGPQFVRRARGYTPRAIQLDRAGPPVVAVGGYFKNTVCVTRGSEAFVSQHIGDLDNAPTCAALEQALAHLVAILDVKPVRIAHDLHPDFFGTRHAGELAARWRVPLHGVQHHHAHIAAVAAEHHVDSPMLGLALDGVGLGTDGGAWGGELLYLDGARCERLGRLSPLRLPGGDRAAREPWRMAAAALARAGRGSEIAHRFADEPARETVAAMLARGFNAPETSSMGRWFDAAAGLLGVRRRMAFEGQAAMLLEGLAERHGPVPADHDLYAITLTNELDLTALAMRVAAERDPSFGAALFHATLVAALADWATRAAEALDLTTVAGAGGCFLNAVLARGLRAALGARNLTMLEAQAVPPNDGGLSLGQAWVAQRALARGD